MKEKITAKTIVAAEITRKRSEVHWHHRPLIYVVIEDVARSDWAGRP